MRLFGTLALSTLLFAAGPRLGATDSPEDPWDQWRGPSRDGTVAGPAWPANLAGLERVWRIELGESYSGPIIAGDRVYTTETIDKTREAVRALDRSTGEELWRVSWEARGKVPFFARANGDWIRSTPAFDGEALYVGGMEEVLVKLDGATGEELWRVDFPARFGTGVPDFGFASSPLVDGDAVYAQAANSLVKLDKTTGETVWRALESAGDMMQSGAFSSPILTSIAGRRQVVTQTREALHGIDPATGEVLWTQSVPSFRGMNILTPVVVGNSILTSSYRNKTYLYSVAEEPTGPSTTEVWTHKSQGYMSTPVVVDGHAYLHLGNGRLLCIDVATGAERWVSQPFGKYWSLVAQGDKILALDEGGELLLLRASPDRLELLDARQIANQPTWAHLAVSGDDVLVRELNAVAAYRWSASEDHSTAAP